MLRENRPFTGKSGKEEPVLSKIEGGKNMKKKIIGIFVCMLLIVTAFAVTGTVNANKENNKEVTENSRAIYFVPGDFPTIQAAVNGASSGDTIIVRDGIYTENIIVNKQLTIRSEKGPSNCVVKAANTNADAFKLTVNGIIIDGFTIRDVHYTTQERYGINVGLPATVQNCDIKNNIVINNQGTGIMDYGSYNIIRDNIIHDDKIGIAVSDSSNYNQVIRNTIYHNVEPSTGMGIWISGSNHNNISSNNVTNNYYGIYLHSSNDNSIYNNNISGNVIKNGWDDGVNNWNIQKIKGTNIIGGHYLGGNYWSDYTGTDTTGDGLGDTPYAIPAGSNKDNHPLVRISWPDLIIHDRSSSVPIGSTLTLIGDNIYEPPTWGSVTQIGKWFFHIVLYHCVIELQNDGPVPLNGYTIDIHVLPGTGKISWGRLFYNGGSIPIPGSTTAGLPIPPGGIFSSSSVYFILSVLVLPPNQPQIGIHVIAPPFGSEDSVIIDP